MRILFVEDSEYLQEYVTERLTQEGYSVDSAVDGEEGLWAAESNMYDVILLDINLPKKDGLTLLKELRAIPVDARIIMLTARDTTEDKILGLDDGADDYLIKPFDLGELISRIKALVRRAYNVHSTSIGFDGLELDTIKKEVYKNGQHLTLQPREYNLLEYLMLRKGEVVSRTDIETHIYNDRADHDSNVVDSAVCRLRKKIDNPDQDSYIKTKRGMGYIIQDIAS